MKIAELGADRRMIATHALHMICPPSALRIRDDAELVQIGADDFAAYRYRHGSSAYRADSSPSEDVLMSHLKDSLTSILNGGKKPLLLLSDGKDSMALAVALSDLNVSCQTLTLLRRSDIRLREFVEQVARKLGHAPTFITSDEALEGFNASDFVSACAHMEAPVLDQGFLFFLLGLQRYFEQMELDPREFVVLDGLGNDEYFGYLPSKDQLRAYRIARLGFWKLLPSQLSTFRWYLRSPAEAQGDLSALSCFFRIQGAYDLSAYFSRVPHSPDAQSFLDFRAFSRGSFHDHQCMMGKTRAAASSLGSSAEFPWLHPKLADYCFNLPMEEKFDFAALINKIPLRRMLSRRVGWSQTKRGVDLYVDLDHLAFARHISEVVPTALIDRLGKRKMLPMVVKSRAYLELLNLFGFCVAHGFTSTDVGDVLGR